MTRLILASASPRRRELLTEVGFEPEVWPADVDETAFAHESATELCQRLAIAKATVAANALGGAHALVVAADTVVAVGGQILGKPRTPAENRTMLRDLADGWHQVHTGLCLLRLPDLSQLAEVATTSVRFGPLSDEEIDWYVASGEGFDKAGGYGIQGRASIFIPEVAGSYANVVGLPIELVGRLSAALGLPLLRLTPGATSKRSVSPAT